MVHKIDHEDLTTRTWVCVKCGCRCLSKNPWRRNTHGEGPGGMTDARYLNHLQAVSFVKMKPAHPPRPKEEAMVVWNNSGPASRDAPFCFIDHEKDIVISVTPYVDINDTGKPIPTPQEQLLKFLKIIRNCSEDVLKNYACAQFGGHEWTDDPALVGEVNGDEEAA